MLRKENIEEKEEEIEKNNSLNFCCAFIFCMLGFGLFILGSRLNHDIYTPLLDLCGIMMIIITLCCCMSKV